MLRTVSNSLAQTLNEAMPTNESVIDDIDIMNFHDNEYEDPQQCKIDELELTNVGLMDENERLRNNMKKLIKSYPKDRIYDKIKNNKCAICLEEYGYKESLILTNCLHIFHKHCIDRSLQENTQCPKCRFDFDKSVFLPMKLELKFGDAEFFD